jgi:hypothetical protein
VTAVLAVVAVRYEAVEVVDMAEAGRTITGDPFLDG